MVCTVSDCTNKHYGKGYCHFHYRQWYYGSLGKLKNFSSWPEYRVYRGMHNRCYRSKDKSFKDYGGRGIRIDDSWISTKDGKRSGTGFIKFITDMGRRPSSKHTIERIDNDGNYSPNNCKWATRSEQQSNKRV